MHYWPTATPVSNREGSLAVLINLLKDIPIVPVNHRIAHFLTVKMSFSTLVQDLSYRDANDARRPQQQRGTSTTTTFDDTRSQVSRARSYASTAATSVSISGDIASQLHGGYNHPLARSWQAERQLTKVKFTSLPKHLGADMV